MADEYYPPVGFYFTVGFNETDSGMDGQFQEVSGISVDMGTEEVVEGGELRFKWQLPTINKFQNLVMKRGVLTATSALATWVDETLTNGLSTKITPKTIYVSLLGADGNPLMKWSFINARPVKWQISSMDSMKNEILTETMEFAYNYFEVTHLGS